LQRGKQDQHFLDLDIGNAHALHNIGEQQYHVIVAHGHVCNNALERSLFQRMVLVLLPRLSELVLEFYDFALQR